MYFKVVPDVKTQIVSSICSKIYVELKLQKYTTAKAKLEYSDKKYSMNSPLVELYNTLTAHHKKNQSNRNRPHPHVQ